MKVKLKPIKDIMEMEVEDMLEEILQAGKRETGFEKGYYAMQDKIREFQDRLVD